MGLHRWQVRHEYKRPDPETLSRDEWPARQRCQPRNQPRQVSIVHRLGLSGPKTKQANRNEQIKPAPSKKKQANPRTSSALSATSSISSATPTTAATVATATRPVLRNISVSIPTSASASVVTKFRLLRPYLSVSG